jgi:uncharacterized membrane protein
MKSVHVNSKDTRINRVLFGVSLLVMIAFAIYAASQIGWIRSYLF